MATLNQIRTAVDDRLEALWPLLVARQDTYFTNKGRYFQGLITHLVVPNHLTGGADPSPAGATNLAAKPADQVDTYGNFGLASWTEIFAVAVHMYDGPLGKGWWAECHVRVNGTHYIRARGQGPEDRNHGWKVYPGSL